MTESHFQWVSLTGGEPLLRPGFLEALIPNIKREGFKIFLETSGIYHENLRRLEPAIDFISMDVKLPSTVQGRLWWDRHREFLAVAPEKTAVKVVVTAGTPVVEFAGAMEMLRQHPRLRMVVIQPATKIGAVNPPPRERLELFWDIAWAQLSCPVRLMPQHHPVWKLP
jgi:organic radical activating enzyme